MKRFTRDEIIAYITKISALITEANGDNSYYKIVLQDLCKAYVAHDDNNGMPVIDRETEARLSEHISYFEEAEIFLKNNPMPLEVIKAQIPSAAMHHVQAEPPLIGNVGFVPAYAAAELPDQADIAVGAQEIRAMPAQAPIKRAIDPAKQLGFDQMVAKIKQIDIAISKGQAVRKKEYLKGCFNEVLQEVKSHEAELLNHNLDIPLCLRKSVFMQQCTSLNADAEADVMVKALLGLTEASFDALIL